MVTLFVVDLRTTILLLSLGNLATIAALAAYGRSSIPRELYWQFLTGKLLQAAAWLLLGQWGNIPDFLSVYVGNPILFAGFALEALALMTTDGASRRWVIIYAIITGVGILSFWGFAAAPNLGVGIASLVTVVIYSIASFFLLSTANDSRLRRILGVMYGVFCLILLLRTCVGFLDSEYTLMAASPVESLAFLSFYLLTPVGSIGFLLILRERTDLLLVKANRELDLLSPVDSLTNLANRHAFDKALTRSIRECRRRRESFSLLMIDIDHFKEYNDLYGHKKGDECLRAVARQIGSSCHRASDLAVRYGERNSL